MRLAAPTAVLILIVAACGSSKDDAFDALAVADAYFEAYNAGDVDGSYIHKLSCVEILKPV